jgi:predicted nucleic acid-binding protein
MGLTEIVVDTSVMLAVVLDEPERPALIARTRDAILLAPGSVPWEVGNGLVAGNRRRRLTVDQVAEAWSAFEGIALRLVAVSVPRALHLAGQAGLYAYDGYVLEAARAHRAPLLSLDQRQRRAAIRLGLEVWEVEI